MARRSSNILFWAKYVGLALALIIIAAVLLNLQSFNIRGPKPEGASKPKSVAEGMSEFYAAYRMSSRQPFEENIGDFVMQLNPPKEPLDTRLKNMVSSQKPTSANWVSEHKFRSFKAGRTIREVIEDYAQNEGMQVLWELDKDFIIKNQFQMENTITDSLAKIARVVDGSFEGEVKAYICPKQRSLIITEKSSAYIRENCSLID